MSHLPCAPYCSNRLFEWTTTVMLILIGIHLTIWPNAVNNSAFRFIYDIVGASVLLSAYLFVGWFRVLALIANGRWPRWGPRIRAVGCVLGALIWLNMDMALVQLARTGNVPSPGIWVYATLVVSELISAYRAASDARHS